ncbi:XdhC family protein [Undibacterium fentianense]|uniref:XdhC family protein n=1 Tax=Undibacterium fentianense TaxID=2828728 RepID=A0A941E000_9BURK|nr:XdhC family protein [Undibacterium fentianense]MBR7798431.1 XdhC family protein [Undibacterium fentianense]
MDSIDLEVLKASEQWMASGIRCELVTVVKTWGSSPRPEGAMLVISEAGQLVGSVSGGCIEDDLVDKMRRGGCSRIKPELVTYGVSAEEAHRFGLPCGGTIQLLIEPLHVGSQISSLLQKLENKELVARELNLQTGAVSLLQAKIHDKLSLERDLLRTIHGPRWRLLIIGAGQMSQFLANIAQGLDYQVTVCDPREEYLDAWHLDGVTFSKEMPDDTVIQMKLDAHSAVVALSHDPKLDDLALMEALKSPAFYVGAIGSRANNSKRRVRLKEFDLTDAQIARLHGPIGFYIGSKTPAEIAISILAEMTAVKNRVPISKEMQVAHAKEQLGSANSDTCSI